MSETIGEMILPGTYIDVRSEGLIGVGGISTGNIGIVGTASRGPLNTVTLISSYADAVEVFGEYDEWDASPENGEEPLSLTRSLEQLFKGGASTVYAVRVTSINDGAVDSASWNITDTSAASCFTVTANTPGTWGNDIAITVTAPVSDDSPKVGTMEVIFGRNKESFEFNDAEELHKAISANSKLLKTETLEDDAKALVPTTISTVTPVDSNGPSVTAVEVEAGLALLATSPVNIVTVAGLDSATISASLLAHLEATENEGKERIAVVGTSSDDVSTIVSSDAGSVSNARLILVAPGIKAVDAAKKNSKDKTVSLPAPYAAAIVAGKLSTLAPHISLTNKDVPVQALSTEYNKAQQKELLQNEVLVLHKNLGTRILKGITTDTGAFKQISVRRIVDYAKEGVRIGSNPYIGRLNNSRVRSALKATLDGFLSQMCLDEMLTGYTLDVSATRSEEINGIALVTMTLQPTFSIDYIKVIMNLA